ncbi:MAG: NAD-dependent epimerase/dehydratase family protein [Solirubrobacterales bacterium]
MAPLNRVLVLGGGFICSHLAQCLADEGASVTVFSRSFSPLIADGRNAIALVRGDICDAGELPELIGRHDIVVHGAASSTPARASEHAPATLSATLLPLATVLSIMRDQGGGKIALLSSGGTVYGRTDHFPTPEDHPLRPISEHGTNFAFAEQLLGFYGRTYGIEEQVLRLANVFGPGQRTEESQGVVAHWLRAIAEGEPVPVIGSMDAVRDFIFVEDAARAIVASLRHGSWPAIYNIGSAHAHSLAELLGDIETIVGREIALDVRPARGVDLPKTHLDIGRIGRDTGWHPAISLLSGLERTWHAIDGRRGAFSAPPAEQARGQAYGDSFPVPAT